MQRALRIACGPYHGGMAQLESAGTRVILEKECVIGRHRSCGLVVRDAKASRKHTRVFLLEGDWWVEDLGSANGTKVNGKTLKERQKMAAGDVISIGATDIRLLHESIKSHAPEAGPDRIPPDMVGRTISGYLIDGEIGKGVTGTIFTATQLALERGVAFKVLEPSISAGDPGFVERFNKTITKAASLTHDGLVKIHECGVHEGLLWYTMELVHGDTLDSLLQRDGKMEPMLALMIIEKAADALQAAHAAGLSHGDVKPATIMLTESGHVKILDIGVAGLSVRQTRRAQNAAATRQVYYLAPEQAIGGKSDAAGDVYSLGCVLVHALTGKPPYGGADFDTIATAHTNQPLPLVAQKLELPEAVDKVISQMMAKNPEWRYESMQEVKNALHGLRESITPDAASQEQEERARSAIAARANRRTVVREREKGSQLLGLGIGLLAVCVVAIVAWPHIPWASLTGQGPVAAASDAQDGDGRADAAQPSQGTAASADPAGTGGAAQPSQPAPDAQAKRWHEVSAAVEASMARGDWGAAEIALTAFASRLGAGAPGQPYADQAKALSDQLALKGDSWYQSQLQGLPPEASVAEQPQRLRALAALRDVTLAANRPDAEARYQQALAALTERLAEARRQARLELQAGHLSALPQLASSLRDAFAGTPVAALQTAFAALTREAAAGSALWQGDWQTTRSRFVDLKGAACLSAAAQVLIAQEADSVALVKRLLSDPSLASPAMLKRKAAMLGQQVAILAFRDPADLQMIETAGSEPRMDHGALRGEDSIGVVCTVPVTGGSWSAEVTFAVRPHPNESGAMVVSVVHSDDAIVMMRIGADAIHVRAKDGGADSPETRIDHALGVEPMHVRFRDRDGQLTLLLNDQPLASWTRVQAPDGSQLRCDFAGVNWAIQGMQVLGGE